MTPWPAPIAPFAYRRPAHLSATSLALRNNTLARDSPLHVFCDGPRDADDAPRVAEVRDLVRRIDGFKSVSIVESARNIGALPAPSRRASAPCWRPIPR